MLATLTSDTSTAATVPAPRTHGSTASPLPERPSQRLLEAPAPVVTERKAIPARSMPNRSPLELLILARQGLAEAAEETHDGPRYATAHLAALRAAAAVLAIRARPVPGHRGQVTNVWSLLVQVAPELREWAEFFAATARKRTLAQTGVAEIVTAREADDLLRDADHFIGVVTDLIGLR